MCTVLPFQEWDWLHRFNPKSQKGCVITLQNVLSTFPLNALYYKTPAGSQTLLTNHNNKPSYTSSNLALIKMLFETGFQVNYSLWKICFPKMHWWEKSSAWSEYRAVYHKSRHERFLSVGTTIYYLFCSMGTRNLTNSNSAVCNHWASNRWIKTDRRRGSELQSWLGLPLTHGSVFAINSNLKGCSPDFSSDIQLVARDS